MPPVEARSIPVAPLGNPAILGVASGQVLSPDTCAELVAGIDDGRWEDAVPVPPVHEAATGGSPADAPAPTAHQLSHRPAPQPFPADVMQAVAGAISVANSQHFRFDVTGLLDQDPPLMIRVGAGDPDQLVLDLRPTRSTRKLGALIPLSDGDRGGAPEFPTVNAAGPADIGFVTVYPAFLPYRIAPVASGHRLYLAVWAHGPHFR